MKNQAPAKNEAAQESGSKGLFAAIAIPLTLVISYLIYQYVLGAGANFEGGDPNNHPLPGNWLGIVYKGGFIVPILMTCLLLTVIFSIERFLTISKAKGKGGIAGFVKRIRAMLSRGEVDAAIAECDNQKGSVANVIRSGLVKYKEMTYNREMDTEQKVISIQKDIEETTQLELPMLEKNLVIIATLASVATLIGLLGTVFGMIKAFSAIATAGAPDAVGLANGISEALINTALGIGTSAIAIIMYNYFTSKIDELTYGIDEAGFSITQNFAAQHSARATA
jgi:biopolymer transport protein ExbB